VYFSPWWSLQNQFHQTRPNIASLRMESYGAQLHPLAGFFTEMLIMYLIFILSLNPRLWLGVLSYIAASAVHDEKSSSNLFKFMLTREHPRPISWNSLIFSIKCKNYWSQNLVLNLLIISKITKYMGTNTAHRKQDLLEPSNTDHYY